MAANTEIGIDDAELDALMMELETETADMVVTPTVSAKPVVVIDDDSAALAELDDDAPMPPPVKKDTAAAAVVAMTPPDPAPQTAAMTEIEEELNIDEEMAAIEAEMSAEKPVIEPVKNELSDLKVNGEIVMTAADHAAVMDAIENPAGPNEALQKAFDRKAIIEAEADASYPDDDAPAKPATPRSLEFHIDIEQFKAETRVSATNLDDCFMQQASQLATYASKAAMSEAQAKRISLQVEIAEAKLYNEHRIALNSRSSLSGEKVTEKMVENAVRMDARYAAIHKREIDAESIFAVNKGLVESLRQRRDMLIQLGADRREEGKGQLRTMVLEQEHQSKRDAEAALRNRNKE